MNEPPIIPDIKRMSYLNGEIEHLLGLLDGGNINHFAFVSVSEFKFITNDQVSCPNPVAVQSFMSDGAGANAAALLLGDIERVLWGGVDGLKSGVCLPIHLAPKVIADRVGHTNVSFTLQVYTHLYDEQRREAAPNLAELVAPKKAS